MLRSLPGEVLTSLRLTAVMVAVCCVAYTYAVTGVAQVVFPGQANGSLITRGGQVVGSRLIGQEFTDPRYFQGRPSATVDENDATKAKPYNAANSSGSNLAPSNRLLIDRVRKAIAAIRQANPGYTGDIPVDLVTTDFSGFDPFISPAAAELQVARVAAARGLDPARVMALVRANEEGPQFGILGEGHVNVLLLNLALDDGGAG